MQIAISIFCYDHHMSRKTLVFLGMFIGSLIGGYVPILFGADFLSFTSIIGNGLGGVLGVIIAYKLTANF